MKVVRVYRPSEDFGDVIAFFDIEISGFRINGFRLKRGENCDYIAMPQKKGSDNKWRPIVFPVNTQVNLALKSCIISALKEISDKKLKVEKQSNQPPTSQPTSKTQLKDDELTTQQKIEISKQYLPTEWASRDGIKKMRKDISKDLYKRMKGFDYD